MGLSSLTCGRKKFEELRGYQNASDGPELCTRHNDFFIGHLVLWFLPLNPYSSPLSHLCMSRVIGYTQRGIGRFRLYGLHWQSSWAREANTVFAPLHHHPHLVQAFCLDLQDPDGCPAHRHAFSAYLYKCPHCPTGWERESLSWSHLHFAMTCWEGYGSEGGTGKFSDALFSSNLNSSPFYPHPHVQIYHCTLKSSKT